MKNTWLVTMGLLLVLAAIGNTGCSTEPDGLAIQDGLTAQDEAAIYAAVIRQLATVDDTFGGSLNPKTVYVIENTYDRAGNPLGGQQSDTRLIADTVQSETTGLLSDLSIEIIWIDEFEDAEFEESASAVKGGGAIITLGNIQLQEEGSVHVAGSIYIANLAAGGTTYFLEEVEGIWRISGRTAGGWIS